MLNKGQQLPDDHHVVRYVPWSKLRRDGDDNVVGILPSAFELRQSDNGALSVNWLEYHTGTHQERLRQSVQEFRNSGFDVRPKSGFGVAPVAAVREVCGKSGKAIRVVYAPSPHNPSHTVIQKLPQSDFALLEQLAGDVFAELILNSEVA